MRSLLKVLLFAQRGAVCAPFRFSPVLVLSAFSWLRQFRLCNLSAPFSRDVGLLQIVVWVIDESRCGNGINGQPAASSQSQLPSKRQPFQRPLSCVV